MKVRRVANIIATFLGVFFVVAGIAKFLMFDSFAGTISTVISASASASKVVAGLAILSEIIGGALLLLRVRLKLVATLICFMLLFYIWILYAAQIQGKEIVCNCLGVLNLALPNFFELLLDFLLLDLTVFAAFAFTLRSKDNTASKFGASKTFVLVIFLFVEFGMLGSIHGPLRTSSPLESMLESLFSYMKSKEGYSVGSSSKKSMMLFVDFNDFNCSLCFDDFSAISDSVRVHYDQLHGRVGAMFKSNPTMAAWNQKNLALWAKSNGLVYPIVFASEEMFRGANIKRSSVAVFDSNDHLMLFREIPLGLEDRERVLDLLLKN